jgi:tetratricopeptide (TPR) repeat protein
MAVDLGWKAWLRRKLDGFIAPLSKGAARAVEVRRSQEESLASGELRAIEAEGLAALEAGQPGAAAGIFRRQEGLARRMRGLVLSLDTLEPARAGLLVARALERSGEPFAAVEDAARGEVLLRPLSAVSLVVRKLSAQSCEHARAGRRLAARALIEAALALFLPWKDKDPAQLDSLRSSLIGILRELKETAEVERQLRLALAEREQRADPLRCAVRDELAHHCKTQGRWDEALALHLRSIAELRAEAEHADPEAREECQDTITWEQMRVIEALHRLGRKAEAFAELDQAESQLRAEDGPDSHAYAAALRLRGELLRADGREEEAAALLTRAEAIHAEAERREREAAPKDDPRDPELED